MVAIKRSDPHTKKGEMAHSIQSSAGSTVRLYRLRSNVNPLLGSTIKRSIVVVIVAVVVYYNGTIAMQGVP